MKTINTIQKQAGQDLSNTNHVFVKLDTDGNIVLCSAGETAAGALQDSSPKKGELAPVAIDGVCKIRLGGTVAVDDFIAVGANGKAVAATSEAYIAGQALQAGVSGDLIEIRLGGQSLSSIESRSNISLSNLDTTSINESLIPNTDETIDLGSADKRYTSSYVRDHYGKYIGLHVGSNLDDFRAEIIANGNDLSGGSDLLIHSFDGNTVTTHGIGIQAEGSGKPITLKSLTGSINLWGTEVALDSGAGGVPIKITGVENGVNANDAVNKSQLDTLVVGPGASTDSAVALFDGVSGLLLKESNTTIDSVGTIRTGDGSDPSFNPAGLTVSIQNNDVGVNVRGEGDTHTVETSLSVYGGGIGPGGFIGTTTAHDFSLYANNTTLLALKSDGTIEVLGTISPATGLDFTVQTPAGTTSPNILLYTGNASAGGSGGYDILSGNGTTFTGDVNIGTGNASAGNSGSISIYTGTATGTAGYINLAPGTGPLQINGTNGASGTFTSQDGKTITVTKGIITSIV